MIFRQYTQLILSAIIYILLFVYIFLIRLLKVFWFVRLRSLVDRFTFFNWSIYILSLNCFTPFDYLIFFNVPINISYLLRAKI